MREYVYVSDIIELQILPRVQYTTTNTRLLSEITIALKNSYQKKCFRDEVYAGFY